MRFVSKVEQKTSCIVFLILSKVIHVTVTAILVLLYRDSLITLCEGMRKKISLSAYQSINRMIIMRSLIETLRSLCLSRLRNIIYSQLWYL